MAFEISRLLLDRIITEAAAADAEICGLLLGHDDRIEEVRACHNVATDPARRFEIDPAALIAAYREVRAGGRAILGCYHSHPSGVGEPSARDAAAAEPNDWLWLIAGGGQVRAWRAQANGGWWGRFDEVPVKLVSPSDAE